MKKTLKNFACQGMTLVCLAAISWSPMVGYAGQCGNDHQGCDESDECCEEETAGANSFTVYTGNVSRQIKELEIWGGVGEHQLVWKRSGNSRFDPSGQRVFGWAHNWRHSYQWQMADAGINAAGQPQLDIFYPGGTNRRFTKISPTEWRSTPKVQERIYQNGTTFTLRRANGWQYHFQALADGQGNTFYQIQSFQDSQQATYTFSYGAPGPNGFPELTRISEPAGRFLSLSYINKPYFTDQTLTIATIVQTPSDDDWTEIPVKDAGYYRYVFYGGPIGSDCAIAEIEYYEFGTNQKLNGTVIGTSPAKSAGHEYDKAFDGNPATWFEFSNVYYGYTGQDFGSAKRIGKVRFRSAPGFNTAMVGGVFRAANIAPASDRVISEVSTSDGRSVTYNYNNYPDSVLPTDYIGIESASYDDGTSAQYNYAAAISGTVPVLIAANDTRYVGQAANMEYQYRATDTAIIGFIHKELNGLSGATLATLSGDGNQTMFVDYPNGAQETYYFPYNHGGQLATHTNALGYQKSFTYDQGDKGYLISETDANGNTTQYQRNAQGVLLSTTYADGSSKSWTRDNFNLVLTETDALGHTTTYTRDSLHRVTRIDYADQSYETFSYNSFNQVTQHRLRNAGIEHNAYNGVGLKTSHTDALGHVTTYGYDTASRLASVTDANGHTTQFQYNERGLVTQVTHADGTVRQMAYNDLGKKVSETNELGNVWSYTYDEFSRLTSATDPLKRTTHYDYGIGLGGCSSCHMEANPTAIILPSGKETSITYDLIWRKTSETAGANSGDAATTQYAYDPVGNLITRIDPSGGMMQYFYDARNRTTDAIDPLGRQTSWSYDADGNKQAETRPDGSVTQFAYDEMNRPTTTIDPLNQKTIFKYDNAGNLAMLIDPKNNTYEYDYDLLNRVTQMEYPDSSKESFDYDAVGNRSQYTNRANQVMTCSYNSRNREIACDWSDATPDTTKVYDSANRLVMLTNGVSQIHYTYDPANQLLNEHQTIAGYPTAFDINHQYNDDSQQEALVYPSGTNVQYLYSGRNQLTEVLLNNATLATYQYETSGQRLAKTMANGTTTNYAYDAAHQITKLNQQNAGGAFANSQYVYNLNGNRTSQQRVDGTTESYGYDATDQLTAATYSNQAIGQPNRTVNYTYDAVGNRQQVADNGNNTAYTTNPLNQYTLVGGSSLAYDANGNLTGGNGWTYTYDAQNRITSAQRGGINMSFAYDPLNRCVKRTLNGTVIYLCYAGWNLIEEHNGSGTLNATYIHGASTDEILTKTDANGTVYYHHDALGNVTHLSDGTGALIEQYRYDAFGSPTFFDAQNNVLANSAYGNRFLFTGREWLQDIRLYDYRNRIYSSELGRFPQTDPIRFEARDVNLYRYCTNNPVNRIDPTGKIPALPIISPAILGLAGIQSCAERISAEVAAIPNPPGDGSSREAHCIASCRISRECAGGRLAAWIAGTLVDPPTDQSDEAKGDRDANKKGRECSENKKKSCEELCKGTR